jgi:cytochrome P450
LKGRQVQVSQESEAVERLRGKLDFDDPDFHTFYEDVLTDLVGQCPVTHSSVGEGYWVVSKYEDVTRVLRDWESFTSARGFIVNRPPGIDAMLPIEMDPPRHRSWRALLNPYFNPARVADIEGEVRAIANGLIDNCLGSGEIEFVGDFAAPFAADVISRCVLHFPDADMPSLGSAIKRGLYGVVNDDGSREFDPAGFTEVHQYATAYLATRKRVPGSGDVVDAIVEFDVDDGEPVSDEERALVLYTLIFAGLDTTSSTLAAAVSYLSENTSMLEMLRDDSSMLPAAVEEFLRLLNPGVCFGRYATQDISVGGADIRAGDQLAVFYAAANRDPREFGDPSIRLGRSPNRHVAFGYGVHRCLGSHLARMTLRVALEQLTRRVEHWTVPAGGCIDSATNQRRQILSLPLRLG